MKKFLALILTLIFILSFCCVAGCNITKKEKPQEEQQQQTPSDEEEEESNYDIDQSQAFGIGEVFIYGNPIKEDIDRRVKLMSDAGVKSTRFWFRNGYRANDENSECFFRMENKELVVNEKYKENVKYCVQKLKENGIEKIIFDVYYMYGKISSGKYIYYESNFPEIGSENYILYMQSIEEQFKIIAETFPEITYFEMGNEMNGEFTKLNYDTNFSNEDKATLVLDFSYYALKGIKAGNPNAKGVLNGICEARYYESNGHYILETGYARYEASFLNILYNKIESGEYPTVGEKTTKIEDFFEVLAWHMYSATTVEKWIQNNELIYSVVKEHGDEGRPVFITECGIENVSNQTEAQKTAGELYCDIINNIHRTPYIEALMFFILSDNDWCKNETDRTKKTYVLCYKNQDGSYDYSDAYLKLKETFGTN